MTGVTCGNCGESISDGLLDLRGDGLFVQGDGRGGLVTLAPGGVTQVHACPRD